MASRRLEIGSASLAAGPVEIAGAATVIAGALLAASKGRQPYGTQDAYNIGEQVAPPTFTPAVHPAGWELSA